MNVNLKVDVHPLTRVEGHGQIKVRVKEGRIEEASWNVVETPRYFEVMLKGRHFASAPFLASRICGICSISHTLTSLRAVENAFDVEVPKRAAKLRLLGCHGETLQSHLLHLLFLAPLDLPPYPGWYHFAPLWLTLLQILALLAGMSLVARFMHRKRIILSL